MGNLFHCDHLVARGDVLKDFQLSQKVVRKLHIGDALFFLEKFEILQLESHLKVKVIGHYHCFITVFIEVP